MKLIYIFITNCVSYSIDSCTFNDIRNIAESFTPSLMYDSHALYDIVAPRLFMNIINRLTAPKGIDVIRAKFVNKEKTALRWNGWHPSICTGPSLFFQATAKGNPNKFYKLPCVQRVKRESSRSRNTT